MRIAINLIPFHSVQGIEVFTKNIVSELMRLAPKVHFSILASDNLPEYLSFEGAEIVKTKGLISKYSKALYQQCNIYPLLQKRKIDLLFSPSPAAPFFYKNKVVVIHDCAYDRFPEESHNSLTKMYMKATYYGAKYFSRKIITVSHFSKNELMDRYRIDEQKIEVIYEGVPEMPETDQQFTRRTLDKFKIDQPYFIYIGNWRPRKNLPALIKAFKLLRNSSHLDYLLVIAGQKDTRFLDLHKEIEHNELKGEVILTGFVSQKEKRALYERAHALVFPSLYEGFGLPLLEAQSVGVPVLTSHVASLPEIAGDSALYVNPYDVTDIAQGMERLVKDNTLREELLHKGYDNIQRFSWQKSAQKLLKVFYSL